MAPETSMRFIRYEARKESEKDSSIDKTAKNKGKAMQAIEMEADVSEKSEITLYLPDSIRNTTVRVIIMYNEEETLPGKKQRQFGQFREPFFMADDFDDPLPESFWLGENE